MQKTLLVVVNRFDAYSISAFVLDFLIIMSNVSMATLPTGYSVTHKLMLERTRHFPAPPSLL